MKKIISLFLGVFLLLGCFYPSQVKANESLEGILKSFDIPELTDGNNEITVGNGVELDVEMEWAEDVSKYKYLDIIAVYKNEKGNDEGFLISNSTKKMKIDGLTHFKAEQYTFLYLKIYSCIATESGEPDENTYYYSHLPKERIEELVKKDYPYKYSIYNDPNDYSFTISDYEPDNEAPNVNLDSIKLTQNKNIVTFSCDTDENQSGLSSLDVTFERVENNQSRASGGNVNNSITFRFQLNNGINNNSVYKEIDLSGYYQNSPYGDYRLSEIRTYDNVNNPGNLPQSFDTTNYVISLKAEDNIFETITKDQIKLTSNYEDGKVYIRKGGFGSQNARLYAEYNDNGNKIELGWPMLSLEEIDFSVVGTYEKIVSLSFNRNSNTIENYTFPVTIEIVEPIGTIVELSFIHEISLTKEEFFNESKNGFSVINDDWYTNVPVKLDNGEMKYITCRKAGRGTAGGNEQQEYSSLVGASVVYNPLYRLENEPPYGMFDILTIYHILDEKGNLLSIDGEILVPYNKRKKLDYTSKNDAISLSSLEGTLPSYTEIEATENKNLDQILGNDYIAYDLTLNAAGFTVQPTENVTVGFDLPDTLRIKK